MRSTIQVLTVVVPTVSFVPTYFYLCLAILNVSKSRAIGKEKRQEARERKQISRGRKSASFQ